MAPSGQRGNKRGLLGQAALGAGRGGGGAVGAVLVHVAAPVERGAPHLHEELVPVSLDVGMKMLDPHWQRGDPPYLLGREPLHESRVIAGKLAWYQAWRRCHWIAFFAMATGVLNYPRLDWRFVSGDPHTVPVGYELDGQAAVVMDILQFDSFTAEESLAQAQKKLDNARGREGWEQLYQELVNLIVPALRLPCEPTAHRWAFSARSSHRFRPSEPPQSREDWWRSRRTFPRSCSSLAASCLYEVPAGNRQRPHRGGPHARRTLGASTRHQSAPRRPARQAPLHGAGPLRNLVPQVVGSLPGGWSRGLEGLPDDRSTDPRP
jgi:hypothetical protein